jgi:hypothetical protein
MFSRGRLAAILAWRSQSSIARSQTGWWLTDLRAMRDMAQSAPSEIKYGLTLFRLAHHDWLISKRETSSFFSIVKFSLKMATMMQPRLVLL